MILRAVGVSAVLAATIALAACTATPTAEPSPRHTGAESGARGKSAVATPSADGTLSVSSPGGQTLIGVLSSQRGINEVGPLPVASPSVAVDVRCLGKGAVDVEVVGVAKFSTRCSTDSSDIGTQNVVDVRYVDTLLVRVSGDDSLLWALAVSASPN